MNPRRKDSAGAPSTPPSRPVPPWFAGALIGMTILGMASGAMAVGAGWAMTAPGKPPRS